MKPHGIHLELIQPLLDLDERLREDENMRREVNQAVHAAFRAAYYLGIPPAQCAYYLAYRIREGLHPVL